MGVVGGVSLRLGGVRGWGAKSLHSYWRGGGYDVRHNGWLFTSKGSKSSKTLELYSAGIANPEKKMCRIRKSGTTGIPSNLGFLGGWGDRVLVTVLSWVCHG